MTPRSSVELSSDRGCIRCEGVSRPAPRPAGDMEELDNGCCEPLAKLPLPGPLPGDRETGLKGAEMPPVACSGKRGMEAGADDAGMAAELGTGSLSVWLWEEIGGEMAPVVTVRRLSCVDSSWSIAPHCDEGTSNGMPMELCEEDGSMSNGM